MGLVSVQSKFTSNIFPSHCNESNACFVFCNICVSFSTNLTQLSFFLFFILSMPGFFPVNKVTETVMKDKAVTRIYFRGRVGVGRRQSEARRTEARGSTGRGRMGFREGFGTVQSSVQF